MQEFPKHGYGFHAVKPPRQTKNNSEMLPYRRISSLGELVEDTAWLRLWSARMCLEAASIQPTAVDLPNFDATQMRGLIGLAGGDRGRELGELAHLATEHVELGIRTVSDYSGDVRLILEKHLRLVSDLDLTPAPTMHRAWSSIEARVVDDNNRIAGTLDRIYQHPEHGLVVADLKTGKSVSPLGCAVQIAAYAGARHYNTDTQQRGMLLADQGVNQMVGIVLHVPLVGKAHARLVDLAEGRSALFTALRVAKLRESVRWVA